MSDDTGYGRRLESIDDAPGNVRSEYEKHAALYGGEPSMLLFRSEETIGGELYPATLLAIFEDGWVVIPSSEPRPLPALGALFRDTLYLELTSILLYGRLKIVYSNQSGIDAAAVEFNTVSSALYWEAVQRLLGGIDSVETIPQKVVVGEALLPAALSMKFRNAVREFKPDSQHIVEVCHWLEAYGGRMSWFRHELSPEALLIRTERELILISDESAEDAVAAKYGSIVKYCPLSRLDSYSVTSGESIASFSLSLNSGSAVCIVSADFPIPDEESVRAFLQDAVQSDL